MKLKTIFVCQNCSFQSSKWMGKCPECENWNSFVEDTINIGKTDKISSVYKRQTTEKPVTFTQVEKIKERVKTGIDEFDNVLGGGVVDGSLILLSGEPGIGKSTITLQILEKMAAQKEKVLYITGEESIEQISQRAYRLSAAKENIQLLYETNLENILKIVETENPGFLVVDSIQVISSEEIESMAGTISQVRYVTESIMSLIKTKKISTLLIGHVNKDGNIAGPKVLEHLVDAVFILEGERDQSLRLFRAVKNRYGPVNEVGIFEITEKGLLELKNPAEKILQNRLANAFGSCLTISMEGNRPLLMEVQALVNTTPFGYPKRASNGFDRNRLEMIIAVLEKYTDINLSNKDVYINITEGLSLKDTAADLAIAIAITSSYKKKSLPEKLVLFGEIGLGGEIRKVFNEDSRKKAIKKLDLNFLENIKSIKTAVDKL